METTTTFALDSTPSARGFVKLMQKKKRPTGVERFRDGLLGGLRLSFVVALDPKRLRLTVGDGDRALGEGFAVVSRVEGTLAVQHRVHVERAGLRTDLWHYHLLTSSFDNPRGV